MLVDTKEAFGKQIELVEEAISSVNPLDSSVSLEKRVNENMRYWVF